MPENVRLVIWDLDETFWKGTLSEGGHTYLQENHDIVVALARRGIMSSICSKNDSATIEPILRAAAIWDYFIFPSINWNPKGPRIRDLIDTVGLRPATVMLIDDNPTNLNEALHFVPSMQVAPESFIPRMLESPLFTGKDDAGLSRLANYKALEWRRREQLSAGDDNREFLRGSNLHVRIDHDIEHNIDRVIELVNRTNQLNFTKRRLSEDIIIARTEITSLFAGFAVHGGLIHVEDKYGDYGFCGFYAVNAVDNSIKHFCFSCRILNMGVERWVYDKLGRPRIAVTGDVATDLFAPMEPVDWINTISEDSEEASKATRQFKTVFLRGGCELQAIAHYLSLAAEDVRGEYFEVRHGLPIRTDHSLFTRFFLDGIDAVSVAALAPLGYAPKDFVSQLTAGAEEFDLFVFSFWQNATHALYRHRTLGIEIPFEVLNSDNALNVFEMPKEALDANLGDPFAREAVEYLRRNFDHSGVCTAQSFRNDVVRLIDILPADKPIFILLQKETWINPEKIVQSVHHHIWGNSIIDEIGKCRINVFPIPIQDHLMDEHESIDGVHFKRHVYFRIHETILKLARDFLDVTQSKRIGKLESVD